ncbi:FtsX-like permease family protein [Altericroceibacterium spongiae]|uniref:FtsX-like permease family protein n=2 Tax=Altericroceibacterium spongiae TaxID=2320269 RepID=A0A420ESA6_9SPHN|nr:FtsX-like permease family protein [Altericroceibacterium spongiae]
MNGLNWTAAWRIARRDLHRRFRGLRLLLVCLLLGVGALAAIGSLTGAIRSELVSQGQEILGGDLQVEVWQRPLREAEIAFLERHGTVSRGFRIPAMVTAGDLAAPVEMKAVDRNWPLYGVFILQDGREAAAPPSGTTWLSKDTSERLNLTTGDRLKVGSVSLTVGGIIGSEPDRLSEGFSLGPTMIVSIDTPEAAGLTAPGAFYETKTRLRIEDGTSAQALQENAAQRFANEGLEFKTSDRASPGAERFVSQMGEFLTLVGLAALVIAGIGIGGGVSSYLEARRSSIATLKILGATSRDIARIYALQVGVAALTGAVIGLIAGMLVTPLLTQALSAVLPVKSGLLFDPVALLRAAAFGMLVALIFAAPPILRARHYPAMALMRERVAPLTRAWRPAIIPVAFGLAGIVALALIGSPQMLLSGGFLLGAAALLGLLAVLGRAIRSLAARLPRPKSPVLRAALANIHRPGASTPALVTALGFGLSAFVLLAAVQTSLDANIARTVPAQAPDYFMLDLPRDKVAELTQMVESEVPGTTIRTVPTLRGAILAYGPESHPTLVSELEELPEGAWALRGERGLTYSADIPPGNVLTEGKWWPENYAGEPLVSVDEELAGILDLKPGDIIRYSLLGTERQARIANFRRIDWESMGFNNVFVFSPNALEDAPHNLAATLDFPPEETHDSGPLLRKLVAAFPASSVIEVGPLLEEARTILDQVGMAILAAASVAVLAGIAVLLGALAAARAARRYDTVILRVLGASRRQLILMQLTEFGLLAVILGLVALALGSAMGWLVITQLFGFDWLPDWPRVLAVLGSGVALVLAFALGTSLPLLRSKPAQALRSL